VDFGDVELQDLNDFKSEMIELSSAKASPIFLDHIYPINCKISY
jgi:hypothetical protein